MTHDEWLAINRRRYDLIERQIAGTITAKEAKELESLQQVASERRARIAADVAASPMAFLDGHYRETVN